MTFSDAEEDQPSVRPEQNENFIPASNGISNNERQAVGTIDEASVVSDECSLDINNECTESEGNSAVNQHCMNNNNQPASVNSDTGTAGSSANCAVGSSTSVTETQSSDTLTASLPKFDPSSSCNSASQPSSLGLQNDSVIIADNSVKGLGAEKILEKLQQIHGYIQQTAAAMQALEREGDLNKIGQYNTLVKCMRDLKKSESKLTSHLNMLKAKSSQLQPDFQDSLQNQFEGLYHKLKTQETECVEYLTKNLSIKKEPGSGSESIGVVGELNGNGNPPSMQERLSRHEVEQQQLSERLRESLVRREELMARYQATRERLNNLKRQRLGLVQEERKLLQSAGAPENPYDNPIPGADTWSIVQLESAIKDFQGLRDKVKHLHEAYTAKLQGLDEDDSESRNEVHRKIDQIINKRGQIENALTQMTSLLQVKKEQTEDSESGPTLDVEETIEGASSGAPAPVPNGAPPPTDERTSSEGEVNDDEVDGAVGVASEVADLQAKQQHLQSLKDQLQSMKKLLQVTQETLPSRGSEERNASEAGPRNENARAPRDQRRESNSIESDEPLIASTIVGVNGEVIHLSETERRNPTVVAKYQQLSEAKQRLAKMEEIMTKIAEARQSGHSLSDVLSPEYMAILNEAREEADDNLETSPVNVNDLGSQTESAKRNQDHNQTLNEANLRLPQRTALDNEANANYSRKNHQVNKIQGRPPNDRNEWEGEKEISAMHNHFRKKTSGIPSVNEGFKIGREKGAVKKQTRELLNEGANDPRLQEVAALQEELKEKKNALEALMKRMGKSSSFIFDNMSDNISENVSDLNSETLEKPSTSWGAPHFQGQFLSDQAQSDEDLLDTNDEVSLSYGASQVPANSTGQRTSSYVPHLPSNAKNRNRFLQNTQLNPEHSHISFNNLNDSVPRSVRPKQSRSTESHGPTATWETVPNRNESLNQSSNSSKVQNTVAAALSQLKQVQDTINSLYGDLRNAEISSRQQDLPNLSIYGGYAMPFPTSYNSLFPQAMMPNYCIPPLPNSQGRADLSASNPILAGLQQCFSQLYLHSLEIQSLSKHMQNINREQSISPQHPKEDQRSGSIERNEAVPSGRRINKNSSISFQRLPSPNFQAARDDGHLNERKTCSYSDFEYLNSSSNRRIAPSSVSDSPYGNGVRGSYTPDQPSSSWTVEPREVPTVSFENKNVFSQYEASATEEMQRSGDLLLDSSSQFPYDTEGMNRELAVPWNSMSNPHCQQQSSDILNNQVLPGSRANNYWDNFRSYSRQNPLSSSAKCNTRDQFAQLSEESTSGRRQTANRSARLQTSFSNNSINKASDKNSSSSRSQNREGTRAKGYGLDGRRATGSNSANHYNAVASVNRQAFDNASDKRNNRHDFDEYELSAHNRPASNQNYRSVNNDDMLPQNVNLAFESNNSRRVLREGRDFSPRRCKEGSPLLAANAYTQGGKVRDGAATPETFSQVVREAESLMQKHSEQPYFLLQLFQHAAKITSNTDQQVALELLRELSHQRPQNNNIQQNRWGNNTPVINNDSIFHPTHIREANFANNARISNKNSSTVRGMSGSDASESELTSDDEEPKVLYQMVKNLTPTSSSAGVYPPCRSSPQAPSEPSNNPSSVGVSPVHLCNIVPQNYYPQPDVRKDFTKDLTNIVLPFTNKERLKRENQQYFSGSQRRKTDIEESSLRNYIPNSANCHVSTSSHSTTVTPSPKSNAKLLEPLQQQPFASPVDKYNNKRQVKKSPRRSGSLPKSYEEKANFHFKNEKKNVNPTPSIAVAVGSDPQEPFSGFEALVSAALREVLLCFESADYSQSSLPQILDSLHHSVIRQVKLHSATLGFSANFTSSIDSQLKNILHGFYGKSLPASRHELVAAVTQVLIQEYCYLFLQNDIPDGTEPQTRGASFSADTREAARSHSKAGSESPNPRIFPPQYQKQSSSGSLFGSQSQEFSLKEGRPSNVGWSFSPLIQVENGQSGRETRMTANMVKPREEETKLDPSSNSKCKGAISKNSGSHVSAGIPGGHQGEPFVSKQEGTCSLARASPFQETSSYPEAWITQRGNVAQSNTESGIYPFPESVTPGEVHGREFGASSNASLERNDTEADQEHARNKDYMNVSLPVHDLAEADQSQDPIEANGGESSTETDLYENASLPICPHETKEFTLRFSSIKKVIPEQGLDEVPTRLLNINEGASSSLALNGRHIPEDCPEGRVASHRCGIIPPQASPSHSQPMNISMNEQNASHNGYDPASGSGIGG